MKPSFLTSFALAFCFVQACVLKAGEDKIVVKWGLNETLKTSKVDELYHHVKVTLCYAPISQKDRGWRASKDNLKKDKTCQFTIVDDEPYNASGASQSVEWTIGENVPTATFFVRVYTYGSDGKEVAFGQTTNHEKNAGLFEIKGSSGRGKSIEIASGCFSAISVASLLGFYVIEKNKDKNKRLSNK